MWIILLSIFVFAKDVAGEIDCQTYVFQQCPRPELFNRIPQEVDEFHALCPEIPPYLQCALDYNTKCEEDRNPWFLKTFNDMKALLEQICEEDSAMNAVVRNNLQCLNKTMSTLDCLQKRTAFMEPYRTEVPLDEFSTAYAIPPRVVCLGQILLADCVASAITRKCGFNIRYVTMQVLHKSYFMDGSCPLSQRETLLQDIDEFNLTEGQKTFVIAELERMKISNEF